MLIPLPARNRFDHLPCPRVNRLVGGNLQMIVAMICSLRLMVSAESVPPKWEGDDFDPHTDRGGQPVEQGEGFGMRIAAREIPGLVKVKTPRKNTRIAGSISGAMLVVTGKNGIKGNGILSITKFVGGGLKQGEGASGGGGYQSSRVGGVIWPGSISDSAAPSGSLEARSYVRGGAFDIAEGQNSAPELQLDSEAIEDPEEPSKFVYDQGGFRSAASERSDEAGPVSAGRELTPAAGLATAGGLRSDDELPTEPSRYGQGNDTGLFGESPSAPESTDDEVDFARSSDIQIAQIPEPGSATVLLSGLILILSAGRLRIRR